MIYSQRLLTKVRYATETEYEITVWISEANLQNEISRAEIAKISIGMIDGNLQMESSCACVNEDRVFGTRLKIADITFV